jgi:hypothetical protein
MSRGITQAHCNDCGPSTNHDILATEKRISGQSQGGSHFYDLYEMLKCRGCDAVTLRHTSGASESDIVTIGYYPAAMARRRPRWVDSDMLMLLGLSETSDVPAAICEMLREIYAAVQNNSLRLAVMGIRAVLETVMVEKIGNIRSFTGKLDAFEKAGYLSVRQRGHLDTALAAGHATIHRGWKPTNRDVDLILDIAESIIEVAYLHDRRVDALDTVIPSKRPKVE